MIKLKVIMETIGQLGESGQTMFIWWIAKEVIGYLLLFAGASATVYAIYRIAREVVFSDKFTGQLLHVMGYTGTYLSHDEQREIIEKLRRAKRLLRLRLNLLSVAVLLKQPKKIMATKNLKRKV